MHYWQWWRVHAPRLQSGNKVFITLNGELGAEGCPVGEVKLRRSLPGRDARLLQAGREPLRLLLGRILGEDALFLGRGVGEPLHEKLRVGLKPTGRAPVREGCPLFSSLSATEAIGHVTSGGFGPYVNGPVSMGYVASQYAKTGTALFGEVRGKRHELAVTALPFIQPQFKR